MAPQTTTGSSDSAGEAVCQFIDDKLQRAMVFKSGLETRSLAVISTSGTLVTLLFALTALVLKDNDRAQLSVAERSTLVAGTLFFLLAAFGGILGNAPMRAGAVDPRSIRPLLEPEHWGARRDHAVKAIARSQLAVWIDIDRLNGKRLRILRAAITAEALGVAAIAVSAAQILI
jgi:hypothetical protein